MLEFDGQFLRTGDRRHPAEAVLGFVERVSPWSGAAWTEVQGTGERLPIDDAYGEARAALRSWFPDRPFQSEWDDGRFPTCPLGLPAGVAGAAAFAALVVVSGSAGWHLGAGAGAVVAAAGAWPVVRLRDQVVARRDGLRIGPPWAAPLPWHHVQGVSVRVSGRSAQVWMEGPHGSGRATLPALLLPALRARVRRLGGLTVRVVHEEGLDARYERWRAPATGIPWGVLVATLSAAPLTPSPWVVLTCGLLCAAGLGLAGAAIEARVGGWGAGAVLWLTGLYGLVMAALSLGMLGWPLGLP